MKPFLFGGGPVDGTVVLVDLKVVAAEGVLIYNVIGFEHAVG